MVQQQIMQPRTIYYHHSTTNQSFIDVHNYLDAVGIKNNKFFLAIYDPDLIGVDPRDPQLPVQMKMKVLKECIINYWYFLREVIRIPDSGGSVNGGIRYKLSRGNLALNYLFIFNYNIFLELPRQHGKTTAALVRYLWIFNFGTSNSEIMFVNKKHDDSKRALATLKSYRDALPSYLQMAEQFTRDGKKLKVTNSVVVMEHPTNHNRIRTAPGARTKQLANNLGRGCTMPLQYYDEFAWTAFNKEIYMAAVPAFSTASKNAKRNNAPYGILITTTPGDLTTDEGKYAEFMKNNATPWCEAYYDYPYEQLESVHQSNTNSSFFYVRYTYQQLGSGEDYFKKMVIELNKDWAVIRREVLLEWTTANMNCPFSQEDLDIIKSLCKPPIRVIQLGNCGQFQLNIYEDLDPRFPPIIGVDVSGGQQLDSSAITILDSKTTKVCATFNCNYITSPDLARLIYELVTKYMRNAVVNIERNGGFGGSILSTLIQTSIKPNIYYEFKDKVTEEHFDGARSVKKKVNMKIYGLDNTPAIRNRLMEILFERVELHKDKFIAPILHNEMEQMETKKNGKIEHSSNSHDDQVFSYLMALYVWYDGVNVRRNFNIQKNTLLTDTDAVDDFMPLEEQYAVEIGDVVEEVEDPKVQEQLDFIRSDKTKLYADWEKEQYAQDQEALNILLMTNKPAREAYIRDGHMTEEDFNLNHDMDGIPNSVFDDFYDVSGSFKNDPTDIYDGNLGETMAKIGDYR